MEVSDRKKWQSRYVSNVLGQTQILFEYSVYVYNYFWIFWSKIRYFSNVLFQNQILFKCFETEWETNTFRVIELQVWIRSIVLRRNSTLFECFGLRLQTFQMFCVQMWYISNVLCWNNVLFEYFGNQKFPKFSLYKIRLLSNVWHRNSIFLVSFGPKWRYQK